MDREQLDILQNYRIAMREEFAGLNSSGKSTQFYLERLQRISTLAKNCAGLVGNIEIQLRMKI